MLQNAVSHTPYYVWAILAGLVSLGLKMRHDRAVTLRRLAIMPVAMLGLSLSGVASGLGLHALPVLAWVAGIALGAVRSWYRVDGARIATVPERAGAGTGASAGVIQRGSWWPLVLMLAIFAVKYVLGATAATKPALLADPAFATVAAALLGLFSGLFAGRSARYAVACFGAMRAVTSMPMPR